MEVKDKTALITGCTSGIGYHLPRQFAWRGHPLVLVAPVESELLDLRDDLITSYGVRVEMIAKDLEQEGAAREIYDTVQSLGQRIDILVNNAGHGFQGNWWEQPVEKDESMVALNILAVLRLTKCFLPDMVARKDGIIFNTASVAGFEAGPTMAVYHATKAFVLSWSEALSIELADTGVAVTILCPGPTDTDFMPKSGLDDSRIFQKGNVMAPQDVAEAGYKGMLDGNLITVPGTANKTLVQLRRILTEEAQAKLNKKMYEEVPDRERERGDIERAAH